RPPFSPHTARSVKSSGSMGPTAHPFFSASGPRIHAPVLPDRREFPFAPSIAEPHWHDPRTVPNSRKHFLPHRASNPCVLHTPTYWAAFPVPLQARPTIPVRLC